MIMGDVGQHLWEEINFETFALVIFHPVTTEYEMIENQIKNMEHFI